MTLIRKPEQLDVPKIVKAMIYGQAGMGKTTLALSAPKPLLLDFDGGVHRVNSGHQSDTVQIRKWKDAVDILNENLSAYQTIVVDTVGKMMDFIVDDADNNRITGWKKWEAVNDSFKFFIRKISFMNKHIIFVAHRDTRKEGDETVFIPALREKNYTAIVTELDLLGYLEVKGIRRTITFNPTSRNDGKNTCNLPEFMYIPTVVDANGNALPNTFFQTQIIDPYIANQQKRMDTKKEYDALIAELREEIELITDDVSANDFVKRIDKFNHIGNSLTIARQLFSAKVNELGLVLTKNKKYVNSSIKETAC